MSIYFHKEDRDVPLFNKIKVVSVVKDFCSEREMMAGDINFIYCSDEYLLEMNKNFLNHDFYTDVITFNNNEGNIVSGDIFMSRDRIEENAVNFESEVEDEFIRVCAHGLLHLLGMNDAGEEEKAKMREQEDIFIKRVKLM